MSSMAHKAVSDNGNVDASNVKSKSIYVVQQKGKSLDVAIKQCAGGMDGNIVPQNRLQCYAAGSTVAI